MKDSSDGFTLLFLTSLSSCKIGTSPALPFFVSAPLCNTLGLRFSCSFIFLTNCPWTSNCLVSLYSFESPALLRMAVLMTRIQPVLQIVKPSFSLTAGIMPSKRRIDHLVLSLLGCLSLQNFNLPCSACMGLQQQPNLPLP